MESYFGIFQKGNGSDKFGAKEVYVVKKLNADILVLEFGCFPFDILQ